MQNHAKNLRQAAAALLKGSKPKAQPEPIFIRQIRLVADQQSVMQSIPMRHPRQDDDSGELSTSER